MTKWRYSKIVVPPDGERITVREGKLSVPDNPILLWIEGDGIGPDIMTASKRIWDAAVQKVYGGQRASPGWRSMRGRRLPTCIGGDYFPAESLDAIREFQVGIKGPLTTPVGGGFRSLNVALRQDLDLYACIRPVKWYPGVPSPLRHPEQVDVVIFRENTEDVYAGIEYKAGSPEAQKVERFLKDEMGAKFWPNSGIGIKPISEFGSKRLIRKAIQLRRRASAARASPWCTRATSRSSPRARSCSGATSWRSEEFGDVTITEQQLWDEYGGKQPAGKILVKDRIADIMFQQMLLRPAEYDVIATPNLNGDYLSDAVAAEVGGVGIAPGANIGDYVAVFEATHGTAPKYAEPGQGQPRQPAALRRDDAGLHRLGRGGARDRRQRYTQTVADKIVTYDFARQMDGAHEVKTSEFASAVIERL